MKFDLRIKDLELRSCDVNLVSFKEHTRAEIVKWKIDNKGDEFCFTVASWDVNDEGFELKMCCDRFLDVDKDIFWILAVEGQRLLTIFFKENGEF